MIAALRRACTQITRHSATPLSRASLTYSLSSTSSMAERVRRISAATWNQPMAIAGNTMWASPPRPEVGKRFQMTAKSQIRTMPSQKFGIACPSSATSLPKPSNMVSL